MKYFFILVIFALSILAGCTTSVPTVKNVSPAEFNVLLNDNAIFVIDVHIPEQKHIPGTDAVIPYNNLKSLPEDKNTPIAVYCRSGSMSKEASNELIKMGYTKVYDLIGGRNAYCTEFEC